MQVLQGDWLSTLAMDAVGDGRVPPPSGIGLHDLATPESLREERPSFQQAHAQDILNEWLRSDSFTAIVQVPADEGDGPSDGWAGQQYPVDHRRGVRRVGRVSTGGQWSAAGGASAGKVRSFLYFL